MTRGRRNLIIVLWILVAAMTATIAVTGSWRRGGGTNAGASPAPIASVPEFRAFDQDGRPITQASFKGSVWIADFIFTRCAGPCPMMTTKMAKMQKALGSAPVKLVSFSVDPDYDTPVVLKEYGKQYEVDHRMWTLATTQSVETLHALAKAMYIGVTPASGGEPITHGTWFIVIDRDGKIRGYFSGEDDDGWRKAMDAARKLAS